MKNHWLDQIKKRLKDEAATPSDVPFDRLKALGMIDDNGEVTGHLRRWDAFLAITGVKFGACERQIGVFRCLKPVFGMPGGATIDISRDTLIDYLKAGKKIITATRDERLSLWREGRDVRLSDNGFVRCDSANDDGDNVGSLPGFQQSDSLL